MSNLVAPSGLALPPGRWFHPSEFACKDGTKFPVEWVKQWMELRDLCDAVRDIFGVALGDVKRAQLRVVSGYRTEAYNAKLLGRSKLHQVAGGSFHVNGMAADLAPRRRDEVKLLHSYVLHRWEQGVLPMLGGLGLYPSWIHVDTGVPEDGHLRQWSGK